MASPPAAAAAAAAKPKSTWEYLCIDRPHVDDCAAANALLNGNGGLGWELVAVTVVSGGPRTLYFKRQLT